jgi:hypothetical protein
VARTFSLGEVRADDGGHFLQLVNAGNVELVAGGDIESGDMTLDVSLLSRERTSLAALAAAEDD